MPITFRQATGNAFPGVGAIRGDERDLMSREQRKWGEPNYDERLATTNNSTRMIAIHLERNRRTSYRVRRATTPDPARRIVRRGDQRRWNVVASRVDHLADQRAESPKLPPSLLGPRSQVSPARIPKTQIANQGHAGKSLGLVSPVATALDAHFFAFVAPSAWFGGLLIRQRFSLTEAQPRSTHKVTANERWPTLPMRFAADTLRIGHVLRPKLANLRE